MSTRTKPDRETVALATCMRVLAPLDPDGVDRVLHFLQDRRRTDGRKTTLDVMSEECQRLTALLERANSLPEELADVR